MKNRMLIGIALAVWLAPNALAQERTVLDDFIGSWRGTGTLFGQPADFEMVWERRLKDRFLHLSFRNPFVEAEASYYPTESGKYRGTWIDSRGVELPLSAVVEGAVLNSNWGSGETKQGRTTYHLLDSGAMEVTDEVLRDGVWAQFGHAVYDRQYTLEDRIGWLIGVWQRETERSITEESWSRLSESTFEGESVTTSKASGETVFTESLLLVEMEDELFYIPKVAENTYPVPFKLIELGEDRATFENVDHDFPQRIQYRLLGADSLMVTISGDQDGESRKVDFPFLRKK